MTNEKKVGTYFCRLDSKGSQPCLGPSDILQNYGLYKVGSHEDGTHRAIYIGTFKGKTFSEQVCDSMNNTNIRDLASKVNLLRPIVDTETWAKRLAKDVADAID